MIVDRGSENSSVRSIKETVGTGITEKIRIGDPDEHSVRIYPTLTHALIHNSERSTWADSIKFVYLRDGKNILPLVSFDNLYHEDIILALNQIFARQGLPSVDYDRDFVAKAQITPPDNFNHRAFVKIYTMPDHVLTGKEMDVLVAQTIDSILDPQSREKTVVLFNNRYRYDYSNGQLQSKREVTKSS